MSRTGAMVLAGGRSRRMGQNKALLRAQGHTLLEQVVALVATCVEQVVVVAETPTDYALPGIAVVGDVWPGAGPLGGILTGLEALGPGRHLAVACDMPALQPDLLRFLLEAATPEWEVVAPEIGGHLEPLCAVYRAEALPPLRRFLEQGGRSVQQALTTLRLQRIPEATLRALDPSLATFTNLNTPEEWERWRQALGVGR